MNNYFQSPFKGKPLTEQIKPLNSEVGRYSYYSGHYHDHSFDECATPLLCSSDIAGLYRYWQGCSQ